MGAWNEECAFFSYCSRVDFFCFLYQYNLSLGFINCWL